ncbi:MAG: NAD(P)H-hydrate dehydratase [Gammaproteobacteria bacterium]|nr:NAD(P)H-hydrate dehydratase [Gammaproteobacteria bacterium]
MLLYSPESVYQLDRAAVSRDGYSEIELMQRAGRCVWRALQARWPGVERITVFAGSGNNGGDAFVVALNARAQGIGVQLLVQGDLAKQSATSRHFTTLWQQAGGQIEAWQGQALSGEVVVDGLLGIGLQRELNQEWQQLIAALNSHPGPRVAIDIPSGLNGLTGKPQPVAVSAQLTVTFIGAKTGQYLADGPDYCGELVFEDLGVSRAARDGIVAQLHTIECCRLPAPRRRNTHKNHYGNLLIVGGDQGMSGAVALAARAALRAGAGLVTALVHPECRNNLAVFPEVMTLGWEALESRLPQASVIVVGPGLGDSKDALHCLQLIGRASQPMVVDASALNADFLQSLKSEQVVITPHPGEAAALLNSSGAQVQADRLAASAALAATFGATCVLKGCGTLVAQAGSPTAINTRGNPGMASAGMGDVLAGIIAALIGQGLPPFEAACSAVLMHALCAEDFSADQDQVGLIAGDIIERIPRVVRQQRDPRQS